MKSLIIFLSAITLCLNLVAQKKVTPQPLIIKGRLTNCPESYLKIFFYDSDNHLLIDTIPLDKDGSFYLKTYKIKHPQKTSIQQHNIQINDIYVAPGYNLTITGDAKDFMTLFKSKQITGVGAASNRYKMLYDSIVAAHHDTTRYYELPDAGLLAYIKKYRRLKDSVADVVFGKQSVPGKYPDHDKKSIRLNTANVKGAPTDKYLSYFGKMTRLDNTFSDLYMLALQANIHNFDYDKSVAFVRQNFDNDIYDHLFRDEYMISDQYKTWILRSEYLRYLVRLDKLKDTSLNSRKQYNLEKVNTTYTGAAKQYTLNNLMENSIDYVKTFTDLNEVKTRIKPYMPALNPASRKNMAERLAAKETELFKTQIGKPAPKFALQNNKGENFTLDDFKGKVVYLDLWASWCGPCRVETPDFKVLYNKYKNDNNIAFISIAVSDGINEWKKALNEDKPEWLQLRDKDGIVSKAYVANTIPKFIIVDKQGNIVSFDAPAPSSGKQIEALLNREIEK